MLPMPENNCTMFIPVEFEPSGKMHTGFIDPMDKIIHTQSAQAPCTSKSAIAFQMNDELFWYNQDGTIEKVNLGEDMSLPGISLGAHPLKIPETIYSRAHHLSWPDLSAHSDLNELLATLSRQKQVLEAMGIQFNRHFSFENNVIELKENLIGNS